MNKKRVGALLACAIFVFSNFSSMAATQNISGVYKNGSRGYTVQLIQEAMDKAGYFKYGSYTSYYGSVTEAAVKAFQVANGLEDDGIVGPATARKIEAMEFIDKPVSRSSKSRKYGEYLDWWTEVIPTIDRNKTIFEVKDFYTGISFNVKVTGGTNHADIEALTKDDSEKMKAAWGGEFSWERRPVLVYHGDRVIAASMANMPHAGLDSEPSRVWVSNRSDGYGSGYNYDSVKNNAMNGHVDLHFNNSTRHMDGKQDSRHQAAIKVSAGL